jgi:purine-binding chemotaxis protein CheW
MTDGSLLEEIKRVLKVRAQALAKPPERTTVPTEELELLVCSVSGERYGIRTDCVQEVMRSQQLTPVPCTPPFIAGIANYRGVILAVLDLRRLFDLPGDGPSEDSRVVVVRSRGKTFGIMTDGTTEILKVGTQELASPPTTLTRDRQAFIQGVTDRMIAVMDIDAIGQDPRVVVNEEVG